MSNGSPLDPDMPVQELLLHMGELGRDEIRVARAAIRWANQSASYQCSITEEELILKMAKAMKPNSFWADDRPAEKRFITMAHRAFGSLRPHLNLNKLL